LASRFNLSTSFNYTPYLFSKKVEKATLSRNHFFIVCGLSNLTDSFSFLATNGKQAYSLLSNWCHSILFKNLEEKLPIVKHGMIPLFTPI
jgi:hypothetical protein